MTVVFPDSTLPEPTNGGFETQEEFREYVSRNQDGRWSSALHARPMAEKLADYSGDTIAQAFPLQFPYGYSGLPEDPAVLKLKARNSSRTKRDRLSVLRKYLQHRNPSFHGAEFNLIVENMIMKESIFNSTKMYCNVKQSDNSQMGEKYGAMRSEALSKAIADVRQNRSVQYSSQAANRYLRSIRAACRKLPHSNEAAKEARDIYFSFLMAFGLPAIFLTITPDDLRNYRIVLYSLEGVEFDFGKIDPAGLEKATILADFKIRQDARQAFPGLCAEEYKRIIDLVVKHLFAWDDDEQTSTGMGLFGELLAYCLATEEQGRKSLHGHFLLFIRNWAKVLRIIQRRKEKEVDDDGTTFFSVATQAVQFAKNASSANLFKDFAPPLGVMSQESVFAHENCTRDHRRHPKQLRLSVKPVPDQSLRDMRHVRLCHTHNGHIADCLVCGKAFNVHEIVTRALDLHLGNKNKAFEFPDVSKRLDRYVYESQKNMRWLDDTPYEQACRYFAANALVNIHFVTHTNRCFKKGSECYANLPDGVLEKANISYVEEPDIWPDWQGRREKRYMFRFYPARSIEDVFINSHNPTITSLLGCNNNVMCGMNGRSVFYVTSYNVKKQQKEERNAFERLSRVIVKSLEKQVRIDIGMLLNFFLQPFLRNYYYPTQEASDGTDAVDPDYIVGFRRFLAGIYTHTSGHIVAAPMAHYIALQDSRFRFSHSHEFLPCFGIEQLLADSPMIMRYRSDGKKQVGFHASMDYLYRPVQNDGLCAYEYYRTMESTSRSEAKKIMDETDIFEFTEKHPLQSTDVSLHRKVPCVPIFNWAWLGSSRQFDSSILDPVTASHNDYNAKEKYARRFMILFMPHRNATDLLLDGSHQKALQAAVKDNRIPDEMFEIAENIQNIQNSLEARMPENVLSTETEHDEEDDMQHGDGEEGVSDSFEDMLTTIGGLLASTSAGSGRSEECVSMFPTYADKKISDIGSQSEENIFGTFENVIETSMEETQNPDDGKKSEPADRYRTKTSTLNSLLSHQFITAVERSATDTSTGPKNIVKAKGSWQSILAWGINAELDDEQQTAFSILAATYVLTFYDDAENDISGTLLPDIEQYRVLCQLARKRETNVGPLRMFVTGPAGAGKCTLIPFMLFSEAYTPISFSPFFFSYSQITGGVASICKTVQPGNWAYIHTGNDSGDCSHRYCSIGYWRRNYLQGIFAS
jgi:hypothetical protein